MRCKQFLKVPLGVLQESLDFACPSLVSCSHEECATRRGRLKFRLNAKTAFFGYFAISCDLDATRSIPYSLCFCSNEGAENTVTTFTGLTLKGKGTAVKDSRSLTKYCMVKALCFE